MWRIYEDISIKKFAHVNIATVEYPNEINHGKNINYYFIVQPVTQPILKPPGKTDKPMYSHHILSLYS